MDRRLGAKDLILFVLMAVVIITLFLGMKQYDRQWEELKFLQSQARTQTDDLLAISKTLNLVLKERGTAVPATMGPANPTTAVAATPTAAPSDPKNDPFYYQKLAQAMPGYASGDAFVRGIPNIEKITPLTSTDMYSRYIQAGVLETLAIRDARTLEWVPLLAKSWSISSDGLTITFRIRPEAGFSDGSRLTADDVIFSYAWIMNPKVDAPRERAYYQKIEKVEKDGDDGVVFHFKDPYFKSFEIAAGLQIMSKGFYGKFPIDDFNKNPGLLFGSGPYRLENPTNWSPGKPLKLVRNERYWGAPPAIEKLIFKEFSDDVAKVTDFRNGGNDGLFQLFPEEYMELKKDPELAKRTQHFEYQTPTAGYRYIAWNQQRNGKPTIFADKRVRRAMTMLTDRRWIAEDLSLGLATVITGPFIPGSKQCDMSIKPIPFDPDAAKALLKEAGFTDDNGTLKTPAGDPFKIQLTYPSGNKAYQQMVLFLKDSYAAAGIAVEPNPLNWSVFGQRLKNREFEAITLGWSSNLEGDLYQAFHSDQIKDGGDNMISYSNPELDKTISMARATVDATARMELWHKAHRIIAEDQPYTFLVTRKWLDFISGRFSNIQVTRVGLNDQAEWYVPTTGQKYVQ